jgi:hypothetical protein
LSSPFFCPARSEGIIMGSTVYWVICFLSMCFYVKVMVIRPDGLNDSPYE